MGRFPRRIRGNRPGGVCCSESGGRLAEWALDSDGRAKGDGEPIATGHVRAVEVDAFPRRGDPRAITATAVLQWRIGERCQGGDGEGQAETDDTSKLG